jgi:hypothetical protein
MTALLLAVIALNGVLVKASFDDFRTHGWPEFSETLGQELAYVEPELSSHAAGMFERLLPVYAFELESSLERNKPAIIEKSRQEVASLEAYANGRWPEIQQSLTDMVLSQESILQESLASVMTDEQAREVSHRYAQAMLDRLNRTMDAELRTHAELSESIGRHLAKLASDNPNGIEDVDSRRIVAVALELAGLNLQQSLQ